jgi:molybdopterin converting factor small subunit
MQIRRFDAGIPMYVEFLGIPRERVGLAEVTVDAVTFGDLVRTLGDRFPSLSDLIAADRLHPSIAANLNGNTFIRDPETRLGTEDRVLILSADVGG